MSASFGAAELPKVRLGLYGAERNGAYVRRVVDVDFEGLTELGYLPGEFEDGVDLGQADFLFDGGVAAAGAYSCEVVEELLQPVVIQQHGVLSFFLRRRGVPCVL